MLTIRTALAIAAFAFLPFLGCKRETIRSPDMVTYGENRCGGAPSWSREGLENGELVQVNRIDAKGSELQWNGAQVDQATLRDLLHKVEKFEIQPVTVLVIDGTTDCTGVKYLRKIMDTTLNCSKIKVCVEYSSGGWTKRHPPLPPPPAI